MKNNEIGIALGGGAALGIAHVGVLKAIEESGRSVSHLSGTSIGAFVGAFYAFGYTPEQIEKIAIKLSWGNITDLSLSRYSLLSNEKFGDLIIRNLGDKNIEDADIPLAMIATDIATGDRVVLKKGSLAEAVMASTCLPGIFKPIEIGKKMLVDGGIVENVPIHTLKELGANYLVGVDLNDKRLYERPGNIIDIIVNSYHIIMKQTVNLQTKEAHLMIRPDLSKFKHYDLKLANKLTKQGYDDAMKELKKAQEVGLLDA